MTKFCVFVLSWFFFSFLAEFISGSSRAAGAGTLPSSLQLDPIPKLEHFEALTDELVTELKLAAEQVKAITRSDEILVLVGQSPAYLLPFLEREREALGIAMSGVVRIDDGVISKKDQIRPWFGSDFSFRRQLFALEEGTLPKKEHLSNYCHYLFKSGLSEEKVKSGKLVLIDHSHTGQSITSFAKILNHCAKVAAPSPYPFINLISLAQSSGGWIQAPSSTYVRTREKLIIKHLVELANDEVPRVVPNYPHWNWDREPDFDHPTLARGREWMVELRRTVN